ncbi:3-keto-5-aminohexanoate cleavage protein [Sphingomonas yunnanensis]|uniref:3-keto-5-aminohexanoate cleavage protein n=1 Tax=Sphingomonas yunnanensis TaxID=310400 RepID=UPI001CA764B9|nr:3-keto-5-aminohexanoate cleavage protein [Sphingomonas yunnanensis]MBY9064765.1 3-keto-5-aminohexanoate cleavage protein [Sphingomonas yunnanensis]
MDDLIINFAPTGMVPTKEHTPHVPITASEIVDDVLAAYDLGAGIAHLHTRDALTGAPEVNPDTFAAIIEGIRRHAPDLVICVSLSGRNVTDPELRAAPLELAGALKPDMGSLTLSSLNFVQQASVNSPSRIQFLARRMHDRGIMPELEVFDLGMINYLTYMRSRAMLTAPFYCNVLLGNIAGLQASATEWGEVDAVMPPDVIWAAAGIGAAQTPAVSLAVALGRHVRVGLEDNIWLDRARATLATNRQLVERVVQLAELAERAPMPPVKIRELLGLAPGNERYGRAGDGQEARK